MKKKKVFRSRISVLVCVFIFIPLFIHFLKTEMYQDLYIVSGVFLFCAFIFLGMRYIIMEDKLYLKICFIPCGSVKIADIISMERSYNLVSSPAASLKRLQINFIKGQFWLISPVREEEFIKELKAVNPRIFNNVSNKKGIWRIQDWDI